MYTAVTVLYQNDSRHPSPPPAAARTQELQEQVSRREADMAAMEERYKKYLEKAKGVIRSLDTRVGSPDVSVLRHQVR